MPIDLDDPIALMLVAASALERVGLEAAAYGGLTLGMYGEPRETRDADLAVAAADTLLAQTALESMGLMVVIAFADMTFGGCAISRLSVIGGGQLNTVDLVRPRSARYATAMMRRTLRGSLRGQELRVVSPEDFVILKILATRERDLEDARSVVEKQRGRIDAALVEREVAQLAAELTGHDVRGRFDAIVA
ncbi:MAG TPA: nucleotidyltransferase [Kofleriaceae bacterium]|jgi:predicted nucleotidyltransferase